MFVVDIMQSMDVWIIIHYYTCYYW